MREREKKREFYCKELTHLITEARSLVSSNSSFSFLSPWQPLIDFSFSIGLYILEILPK